jgi:hypothetical protein
MREVAGSTPGLDFYLLCEPVCVSLRLFQSLSHVGYTVKVAERNSLSFHLKSPIQEDKSVNVQFHD